MVNGHDGNTFWAAGQIMLVASSTLTGINFLTTIAVMRAEGMGWMQMPLFTWSILIANLMLFLSIPAFGVGLIQVYLDRVIGTAFYDVGAGGSIIVEPSILVFRPPRGLCGHCTCIRSNL